MKYAYLILFCFLLAPHPRAGAQTAVGSEVAASTEAAIAPRYLTPAHRYTDGVYFTHPSFVAERPDYRWERVAGEMVHLEEDGRVQIEQFGDRRGEETPPRPYAIVLEGTPYFYVPNPTDAKRGFLEFSQLTELGPLAVIGYDTTYQVRQLMKAYNPRNGQPFRQGYIERERTKRVEWIIDMATGRRYPLEHQYVRALTRQDRDLAAALARAENQERTRLLRAVRIYNERYPLALPHVRETPEN